MDTHSGAGLYNLHSDDAQKLQEFNNGISKLKAEDLLEIVSYFEAVGLFNKDGFKGMNDLVPLTSRRGLVLIEPSYEVKTDYDLVVKQVVKAHSKFTDRVYAIWYPVVNRNTIIKMERNLIDSVIKNIQRFELGLSEDSQEKGMTSSGMIVINPPWKLFNKMEALLPKLAQCLGENGKGVFKYEMLVEE